LLLAFGSRIRNCLAKFLFNKSQPTELIRNSKYTVKAYVKEDNITSITYHGKDITSSYVRTWQDRTSIPYKYEFRGNDFQGYLNPSEIVIVQNTFN